MLMFSDFFMFIFFIHTTFTAFIFYLLTDFAHFTIMIRIQNIDEISFTHDSSICLSSFFYLNFQINEKNFFYEHLTLFKNI